MLKSTTIQIKNDINNNHQTNKQLNINVLAFSQYSVQNHYIWRGVDSSFGCVFPLSLAASPLNREVLRHGTKAEVCAKTSTLSFVYKWQEFGRYPGCYRTFSGRHNSMYSFTELTVQSIL